MSLTACWTRTRDKNVNPNTHSPPAKRTYSGQNRCRLFPVSPTSATQTRLRTSSGSQTMASKCQSQPHEPPRRQEPPAWQNNPSTGKMLHDGPHAHDILRVLFVVDGVAQHDLFVCPSVDLVRIPDKRRHATCCEDFPRNNVSRSAITGVGWWPRLPSFRPSGLGHVSGQKVTVGLDLTRTAATDRPWHRSRQTTGRPRSISRFPKAPSVWLRNPSLPTQSAFVITPPKHQRPTPYQCCLP